MHFGTKADDLDREPPILEKLNSRMAKITEKNQANKQQNNEEKGAVESKVQHK